MRLDTRPCTTDMEATATHAFGKMQAAIPTKWRGGDIFVPAPAHKRSTNSQYAKGFNQPISLKTGSG